jgi:hypothetical protein
MVSCFVQNFFFGQHELEYLFFFHQNLTLSYMTKTLNQIIFFSSTKIRIFFSTTLGIRIFFFRKIPYLPPRKLNGRSLTKSVWMPLCKLSASSCARKKGEKYLASNYRPVSLTCICCKILENIVGSNILKLLDKQNILVDCQRGF